MSATPRVQLSLKGRLLSEVAFAGPQLRIGRMRENDVVVNNLAVSRFHATLKRDGDAFVLEDLGSENGTQVNGERVSGARPVAPGDVIQLGKYELRIVTSPGVAIAGPPKAKANDVWDSSQTFLAGMPGAPKAPEGPAKAAPAPAAPSAPEPAPDPEGVFAFGEDDIAAAADAPADRGAAADALAAVGEAETGPTAHAGPSSEHTSLFDFGAPASLADLGTEPEAQAAPSAVAAASESQDRLYAGLIVQREGKLHQLRPWESGELVAGRAPECDIVLADAGVSRRHAAFALSPEGHVVRDLDSVNGIYVNGQRSKRHVLAVGDVVRIESFELTFVLDRQPIGSEVSGPAQAAQKPQDAHRATQFSLEAPALENGDAFELAPLAGDPEEAPGLGDSAPFEANTDGFEILSPAEDPVPIDDAATFAPELGAPAPRPHAESELALPEADLIPLEEAEDEEKPEPQAQARRLAPEPMAAPAAVAARLQLRVSLDGARLSPRAREALAVLAEEGVALDARVSFEAGESD